MSLPLPHNEEAALACFDSLPAVPLDAMLGRWRGEGVPTDHAMDGLLERFGWYGKAFDSTEDVHPLLFRFGDTVSPVNPALVPMGLVAHHARAFNSGGFALAFSLLGRLARTTSYGARLRMTQHRGVTTATMIYDALPICDVFRRLDDDTVLGLMDLRGMEQPFFFALRREL